MALEETGVKFVTEDEDAFKSALDSAGGAVDGFGKVVGDVSGAVANAFDEIVIGALRRVGEFAIETLGNMAQAVLDFGADAFAGALEAEQGLARLAGAIKRAGDEAPITEDEALALADSLKDLAGGSDDAVIAAQAVLLKFQSIGRDTFPDALKTSADLAAILGVDMASAAEQLGRALEDPTSATRLFRASGIALTDAEKKQLKTWEETGEIAKAQTFILDKLSATTSGAAQELADTTAGKWAIFQEAIADAGETIATGFLPVLQTLFDNVIKPAIPIIEELGTAFGLFFQDLLSGNIGDAFDSLGEWDSTRAILDFLGLGDGKIYEIGPLIESALAGVQTFFFTTLPEAFDAAVLALQPIITGFDNLKTAIVDSWPEIKTTLEEMGTALSETFTNISPEIISNVGGSLDQLALFWNNHSATVLAIVSALWNAIVLTIGGALVLGSAAIESGLNYINGILTAISQIMQGNWEGAWNTMVLTISMNILNILGAFDTFFESILSVMGTNLIEFRATWENNGDMLYVIIVNQINKIIRWLNGLVDTFVKIGQAWIDGIVNGIMQKVGYLTDTVVKSITDIMDKARDTLGIASPSAEAAKLIGEPFAEGIAQGILQAAGQVQSAISMTLAPPMASSSIMAGASYSYSQTNTFNNTANNGVDVEMLAMRVASKLSGG